MTDPRQYQFWQDEEGNLWDALSGILLDTYMSGIDGGAKTLPANIQPLLDYNHVNQSALDFARTYRYQQIKGITDTTRKQTQQAIADWIAEGSPLSALEARLAPIYGESRASMIAATETTRAFAQGNLDAWESTGVVDGGTWMTSQDESVCPICDGHDGETVGIGDIDAAPPNASHPGCRCWLQPVVSEDLVNQKLADILSE